MLTKQNLDQLARETRVFAAYYLQVIEKLSEEDSYRKMAHISKEELLEIAKKGRKLLVDILDGSCNLLENPEYMEKIKRDRPRQYKQLLESVRRTNPDYYQHLVRKHGQ